jgi:cobalt-zinc-cadmium efflux system membrane fusion protein
MNRIVLVEALLSIASLSLLTNCGAKVQADPKAEAPPPVPVEQVADVNLVKVQHPEQFPIATASSYSAAPELSVTGAVNPDVSRQVPVISLASGRIVQVLTRLGDSVTKGQLLMKVQSADIAQAYSDYRQAVADDVLSKAQYERSKILFDKGAIAQKDLEVAKDTEDKAVVTVETTLEHLKVLGSDPDHPTALVDVFAPISGVITDQQVTTAAGTQGLASPNPFTISDLSHVWILCDVYENDLAQVHLGEFADIHLSGYPGLVLKGHIGNIGPVLDPSLHTAKVRLELANPGMLRLGMFVTATFHGLRKQEYATVPSSAVLHLHDRDWVYVPVGGARFRRVGVVAGDMLPGDRQAIDSGILPGQPVVANALILQNTVEQ